MPPEIRFVPDVCAGAVFVPLMLTEKGERANVQNEILEALGQMTTRRNHERKRNTRKRRNDRGHRIGESISQFLAARRSKLERSRRRHITWRKSGRICDEARGPWGGTLVVIDVWPGGLEISRVNAACEIEINGTAVVQECTHA